MSEAVKVVVRCRPLNQREKKLKCEVVIHMDPSIIQVQLQKPKSNDGPPKKFTFDGVYYFSDNTLQIYEEICFPLVNGVLEGYNGTVFAYGQTGCGKSYTMMGVEDPPENRGVIPRAFHHIFDQIGVNTSIKYLVRASYLEIYNEEVRDLLGHDSKRKLELHEHPEKGVYVQHLSMHKIHNVKDLETVMELGANNRSVGATLMNVDSSRSHSIFSIDIEMAEDIEGKAKLRAGRLNMVDLAGSERQSKTGATGVRLKEATKINLSLSALGNVISSLVDGKSKHIPYRDSKLTRLLQSSLGGNTKTLMVACISPADNNYEETLSTLRYANRAKNIKNKPKINEDPKDALLREYQDEINRLKIMLEGKSFSPTASVPTKPISDSVPDLPQEWAAEKEEIKRVYEEKIEKLQEKFGKEKANKAELKEELSKLQEERNQQLSLLEKEETTINQEEKQQQKLAKKPGAEAEHPLENVIKAAEPSKGKKDREVMSSKEDALKRIQQLQGEMIGGERASDKKLKQTMEYRHKAAVDRHQELLRTGMENEDDVVIEQIFNSLTDEVRVKSKALDRYREKLLTSEDDIKDMSHEFERERQDYLDTIRRQDQTVQLYDQLLTTVVPLLRRDCNYFNMDDIKVKCKWDRDAGHWILPKLITNVTVLTPTELPKAPGGVTQTSSKAISSSVTSSKESMQEDKYLSYLQTVNDSDEYFKPKRAMEILSESHSLYSQARKNSLPTLSATSVPNAAAVHGVDASNVGTMHPGKRLQSLPMTSNHQAFKSSKEKSLEDLDTTKKRHSLKPLDDIKSRNHSETTPRQ